MRRTFYLAAGAALGVAATRRTRRAKEALQARALPTSIASDLADAIAEIGNAVGSFAADVRAGMAAREAQLVEVVNESGRVSRTPPELAGPNVDAPAALAALADRSARHRA